MAATSTNRCLWCGSALNGRSKSLPGRVQCPSCGAQTTDPLPSPEQLSAAYGSWYRPSSGRFSGLGDAILRRTRATLARRLDRIAPPGPVLDVGAGDGTLLDALSVRGRDALGLERGSDRADIRAADVGEIEGEWAAVVFWHSLEHLPDPAGAIRSAARLLKPAGVLVVAVPNLESLQARAFGDRWFALDLPRHLVHLPAAALLAGLEQEGLEVERVSYTRGGQLVFGWLHGLVGSLPTHPDLYDAIRRADARSRPLRPSARIAALTAGTVLMPAALAGAGAEVALRRGGSVYVEARRG
jgi:SAM-dependent methyltransferase